MKQLRQEVIDALLKSNNRFKKLLERHDLLEKQLNFLGARIYLTAAEQTEIVRLKKLKLRSKDQMEAILVQFEQSPPPNYGEPKLRVNARAS